MRIIIEGCDGTGKSTLVKKLQEKLGRDIIKTSQPKTNEPIMEYIDMIKKTSGGNFIFDRYWVGETIYGPLYRNKGLSEAEIGIMKHFTMLDLYIICGSSNEAIENVFKERGEDFAKIDDIEYINDSFKWFYMKHCIELDMMVYDFMKQGKDLDGFVNKILSRIEKLGILK